VLLCPLRIVISACMHPEDIRLVELKIACIDIE